MDNSTATDPSHTKTALKQPTTNALIRLLFGLLSLLLSTLTLVKAPTKLLWHAAIGATEWGHLLAPVALLALLPGWRRSRADRIGALCGVAAAALFLTPLLKAVHVARHLPAQLQAAFGSTRGSSRTDIGARSAPLIIGDLVRRIASLSVKVETRTYTTRGSQQLELDLYHPPSLDGLVPCVIVIHGGSWNHGSRTDLAPLNCYLAARGYMVASVSYRFAPQHPFPAAADDIGAAVTYLKEHAAELQLDPHQIVLLGRSAGGHLALLASYTLHDSDIRGVVSFYGPADLHYSYDHPSRYRSVFNTRQVLNDFLGGHPDEVPIIYHDASPINFVDATTPPTLLIQGGQDEFFVPQEGQRLAHRLTQAGVPHLLLTLPWATHGGDFNFSGPSGQISTYAVEYFLGVVLHVTD